MVNEQKSYSRNGTKSVDITTVPISELRTNLAKYKREVQFGVKRLAATVYGEIVGYMITVNEARSIDAIETQKSIPLTEFRDHLSVSWEELHTGVDCIYLTFHERPVVAFLSKHLYPHLNIPVTKDFEQKFAKLDCNSPDTESQGV
jgi:predicted RNA methylase